MNLPNNRRGFFNFLAKLAFAVGLHPEKSEDRVKAEQRFNQAKAQGYRHGKHAGRNLGAFGGTGRAKSHRSLYVGGAK